MYVLEWRKVSAPTRGLFSCLFPELRIKVGNKHKNITRVGAETVRHESTYIILFLMRRNESINDDKKYDLYTSSTRFTRLVFVLLVTSQSSLNIDFIHGDIHGRSCKKYTYVSIWAYISIINNQ